MAQPQHKIKFVSSISKKGEDRIILVPRKVHEKMYSKIESLLGEQVYVIIGKANE